MTQTSRYMVFGALCAVVLVAGYFVLQDQQKDRIEIGIGEGGVSIEEK